MGRLIGLGLMLAGIVSFVALERLNESAVEYPLDIGLPLAPGHFRAPMFHSNVTYGHWVQIAFDRKLPWNESVCLSGAHGWSNYAQLCRDRTPALDLSWTIFDAGRAVATGSTAQFGDLSGSGNVVTRELGFLQGESGHDYTLDVVMRSDPRPLAVLHPRLQVQLITNYGEFYGIAMVLLCIPSTLLGLVLLAWPLFSPTKRAPLSRRPS